MKINIQLQEALTNVLKNQGWLYLPKDKAHWSLSTNGFFYIEDLSLSPDELDELEEGFVNDGWVVTLSKDDIEEVIANLKQQTPNPSPQQIFEAFIYFYEKDAFLTLSQSSSDQRIVMFLLGAPNVNDTWSWGWTHQNEWGELEMLQTGTRTGIDVIPID